MNIASTQFSLSTESFEIYLSGCDGICGKSCHNYELIDFNIGNDYKIELPKIIEKIKEFDCLIKKIWILGGEPLLQNHSELCDLIQAINLHTNKELWLWTRFEINEIPMEIITLCDYIKTGRYIDNLKTENNIQYDIKLATSNQNIFKIKGD
jgi:organic radical activating enzyme